jgi:hypothetical protein
MYADASITYTNFLRDAGVDSYWTPDIGVGWRFGEASQLRLGYHGEFGDHYTANGANLMMLLGW